jgi:putative transposase
MIDSAHPDISIARQCELLGLARSSWYYRPTSETEENLLLMRLIDEEYTRHPFYGSRRMVVIIGRKGYEINRKRVQRLMGVLGLEAIYPKPHLSQGDKQHKKYPYLLRGVSIERADHVWSTDITYIRMNRGFVYLMAVIDWYSRYVLSWQLSTTLDVGFCLEGLDQALRIGQPTIFNTDQGCQFTSEDFTERLLGRKILISMDGKGRALDNIFVERLWRTVKYEEVYSKDYQTVKEARDSLSAYFEFYNTERPHQALGCRTPKEVYDERTLFIEPMPSREIIIPAQPGGAPQLSLT